MILNKILFFSEVERETPDYVRNRLNKRLFDKVNAIEMKREEEQREAARSAKMTKEEKRQMRLKKRQQELKVSPLNCLLILEHLLSIMIALQKQN